MEIPPMPDDLNIEAAQVLSEPEDDKESEEERRLELWEVFEAILLAVVTIVTAWSGYQAAQWDGKNALYYEQSSREHTLATRQTTLAGQQLIYDTTTLNSWDTAVTEGHTQLAARLARRFTPDYRAAFESWVKLDPIHDPSAPPSPSAMPGYRSLNSAAATRLDARSETTFDEGTEARHTSHDYLRGTVLLATVLFLIALAQRFRFTQVRRGMLIVAAAMLAYTLVTLAGYPRL
jgi:hypothetical protein